MAVLVVPEVAVSKVCDGDALRSSDGGPTLEDRIAGTWDQLVRGRAAECPACGGTLRPRWSAGAGVVGGRCDACGSALD